LTWRKLRLVRNTLLCGAISLTIAIRGCRLHTSCRQISSALGRVPLCRLRATYTLLTFRLINENQKRFSRLRTYTKSALARLSTP
jgi:hypothetical protein